MRPSLRGRAPPVPMAGPASCASAWRPAVNRPMCRCSAKALRTACRCLDLPGAGGRVWSSQGCGGSWPRRLRCGRSRLRAGGWWRLCRILRGPGGAMPAGSCWPVRRRSGQPARDLLHRGSNVFDRARLSAGETLGAGGQQRHRRHGDSAIRARRHCHRHRGQRRKCAACWRWAHHAINYKSQDFVAEVQRITEGPGVDVILDMVAVPTSRAVRAWPRMGASWWLPQGA